MRRQSACDGCVHAGGYAEYVPCLMSGIASNWASSIRLNQGRWRARA
jgi:hypothetical protein